MKISCLYCLLLLVLFSCNKGGINKKNSSKDTAAAIRARTGSERLSMIEIGATTPAELITFAKTLEGIPYKYGCTDPKQGFDCSGFVTYVFNHFGIKVPRTSADFADIPKQIDLKEARPGDLILFTGTDSTIRTVGHMGIIISVDSPLTFIHATSGRKHAVTESPLNIDYQHRYMKTIRIFPQNDNGK